MTANPEKALDTLAREELGLNPDDLGSPIGAAISSFIAFSIGASLPLMPFLLGLKPGVLIAAAISGAGEKMDEITEWTSVADLKSLRWYFSTFEDQSIHMSISSGPSTRPRARSQLSRWKEPSSRSPMSRPTPRRSRLPHDK
jgi:hypothetical protein